MTPGSKSSGITPCCWRGPGMKTLGVTGARCWIRTTSTRTGGCTTSPCSKVSGGTKSSLDTGDWGRPREKLRCPPLLPGSQFSVKSPDGLSCSALLCAVVPARRLDSVTWQEGRNPVKGHAQYFWGDGAALLLVCPGEGLSEAKGRKPRNIRCLMPQNKRFSFNLAGK